MEIGCAGERLGNDAHVGCWNEDYREDRGHGAFEVEVGEGFPTLGPSATEPVFGGVVSVRVSVAPSDAHPGASSRASCARAALGTWLIVLNPSRLGFASGPGLDLRQQPLEFGPATEGVEVGRF
jgi:hypothetical protein